MAIGLNTTLITAVPNTVIRSSDANSNWSALNNAQNPVFVTVSSQITLGGSNQLVQQWIATDGHTWQAILRTDNSIAFFDATANKTELNLLPTGGILLPVGIVGVAASGDMFDFSLGGGNSYMKGGPGGTSSSRIRFQPQNGTTVAAFTGGTPGLIVNTTIQSGSGGADYAERIWVEDLTLTAGEVVCPQSEDPDHGGVWARCSHDDCPAARLLSTNPSHIIGGQLVSAIGPDGSEEQIHDPDERWQNLALAGRVPARTNPAWQYELRMPVVSAGNGQVRPMQGTDAHKIGEVCALTSDVSRRPLAPGCVLIAVR